MRSQRPPPLELGNPAFELLQRLPCCPFRLSPTATACSRSEPPVDDTLLPVTQEYYSVTTAVDGALALTLGPTPDRNVQLGFAAPDQTLGAHGDAWGDEYSVAVNNLQAGAYFAALYLYGFSTDGPAGVTLSATFEPAPLDADAEPNDEFATPLPLESGIQVTGHLGYDGFTSANPCDEDDYYAIEVLDGGSLDATLRMAAASADNALVLYDVNQARVEGHDITLPDDQVTIHRDGLPEGIYYLQVRQYGFGYGSYYLEATVTNQPEGLMVTSSYRSQLPSRTSSLEPRTSTTPSPLRWTAL